MDGAPGGIRTHDPQLRKLVLYPLSYGRTWNRNMAEREGFEPSMQVTPHGGLANRCTRPLCDLSTVAAAMMLPRGAGRAVACCRRAYIDEGPHVRYRPLTHMSDVFYFRCPA